MDRNTKLYSENGEYIGTLGDVIDSAFDCVQEVVIDAITEHRKVVNTRALCKHTYKRYSGQMTCSECEYFDECTLSIKGEKV